MFSIRYALFNGFGNRSFYIRIIQLDIIKPGEIDIEMDNGSTFGITECSISNMIARQNLHLIQHLVIAFRDNFASSFGLVYVD